jgi:hypothetical protein
MTILYIRDCFLNKIIVSKNELSMQKYDGYKVICIMEGGTLYFRLLSKKYFGYFDCFSYVKLP